jgi:hypothetical protein
MPARPKMIRIKLTGTKSRPDIDSHQRLIQFGFILEPSSINGLPDGMPRKLEEQIWPGQQYGTITAPTKDVYTWTYRLYSKKFVLDGKEEVEKSGSDIAAAECPSAGAQLAINVFQDALHGQIKLIDSVRHMMDKNCLKVIYLEVADVTTPGSPEKPYAEVIFDPFNIEGEMKAAEKQEGGRRRRRAAKTKRRRPKRATRRRS